MTSEYVSLHNGDRFYSGDNVYYAVGCVVVIVVVVVVVRHWIQIVGYCIHLHCSGRTSWFIVKVCWMHILHAVISRRWCIYICPNQVIKEISWTGRKWLSSNVHYRLSLRCIELFRCKRMPVRLLLWRIIIDCSCKWMSTRILLWMIIITCRWECVLRWWILLCLWII